MCTGKRQTHIRNAPSSRTAVTGIGPYGICMSAYGFARNFRKINCISAGRTESSASYRDLQSGLIVVFLHPV